MNAIGSSAALALVLSMPVVAGAETPPAWRPLQPPAVGAAVCPIDDADTGNFFCLSFGCPAPGRFFELRIFDGAGGVWPDGSFTVTLQVDGNPPLPVALVRGPEREEAAGALPLPLVTRLLTEMFAGATLGYTGPPPYQYQTAVPLADAPKLLAGVGACVAPA